MNARASWNRKYFTDRTNEKDINARFEQVLGTKYVRVNDRHKTELVKCRLQNRSKM